MYKFMHMQTSSNYFNDVKFTEIDNYDTLFIIEFTRLEASRVKNQSFGIPRVNHCIQQDVINILKIVIPITCFDFIDIARINDYLIDMHHIYLLIVLILGISIFQFHIELISKCLHTRMRKYFQRKISLQKNKTIQPSIKLIETSNSKANDERITNR